MTRLRNIVVALLALAAAARAQERVVVYVSLDEEHSRPVLEDFTRETGIEVVAEYDTEQTKSVDLVNRLITERQRNAVQADVYWNNEIAGTIRLEQNGVLERYVSPSAADIPAQYKDPDGFWTGFAMRARVLIVNTDLVAREEYPTSMWDLAKPKWRGRVAMAKPETGTTATHAACLYVKDPEEADRYFDALLENDVVWRTGNAHVMRDVRDGRYAFGWTDTDDYWVARRQGYPVDVVYPDTAPDGVGTLFLPNTLVLIRGGPNPAAGKKLIDWLLRPEIEERLAKSDTAQVPVRAGIPVPEHVKRPGDVGKAMEVDFERAGREFERWTEHVRNRIALASRSRPTLLWIVAGVVALALIGFVLLRRATAEPT